MDFFGEEKNRATKKEVTGFAGCLLWAISAPELQGFQRQFFLGEKNPELKRNKETTINDQKILGNNSTTQTTMNNNKQQQTNKQ